MKTRHHHMPALTRTFAGLDRCQQHRGELLTREGTCPRCDREQFAAHIAIAANAKKLRDPKFYTARTKRAVNSLTVERGPKAVPHE